MEKRIETGGFFLPALTLIFIALKLTGYITWSWLWVLAPLWIPAVTGVTLLLIVLAVSRLFIEK